MKRPSLRTALFSISALAALTGCPKKNDTGTTTSTGGPSTAGKAPTSLKIDKTSSTDGPIKTDGNNDGAATLTIDGPVSALALITVDASGAPADGQQWDTVTGKMPAGWKTSFEEGGSTWQLAVEENGKPMNAKDGTLTPLGPGKHVLMLYGSDSGFFTHEYKFMVLAERPDHSVVKSNIFSF